MFKLAMLLLLLLATIGLGWELRQDSGYVLVNFRNGEIQTSLWMAALLLLATFVALYAVLRLIACLGHWPQYWRQQRQDQRQSHAQCTAEMGGCALIEEQWETAEQDLKKAAADADHPLMHYIGAALAAQEQGAFNRRDDYLHQAYKIAPNAEITLAILQAKLQVQSKQWLQARMTLNQLQSVVPQHPLVKKLLGALPSTP